ncbi:MAG TPA: FAD/NAD(P)-binding oxidoreductase [Bacteroidetes bacterium]|nr:FAD/NAD(P)-binding oxidoreductase [Bacteroidota bacterium]
MKDFHVAIIGGGIIGSTIAWELSKYELNTIVFEKGSDVASGTSKANSGVIHSGINSKPNSLKAKFCVEGNKLCKKLSEQLGFPIRFTGKYVVAKNNEEIKELKKLEQVGKQNGVLNLEIQTEINEPNVPCEAALWVPTAGVVSPYQMTIAFAENAAINNVKFLLETKVTGLKKQNQSFLIKTNKRDFKSNIIINATGLNSKEIVSMLEKPDFKIYPCRGEYLVLDKNYNDLITSMIYPIPPKELGVLGVHITPTIEGNILLGPSAEYIDDPEDKITTKKMMKQLLTEAKELIPSIPDKSVISAYSGIRCKLTPAGQGGWADYRIEESKKTPGLINLLGIESPGLTAAPAIAKYATEFVSKHFDLKEKSNFKIKKQPKRFNELSKEEQSKLIKKDPSWGRIVCRCEHVTEREVIDALSNPLGAKTLSSVKYRCRAGMGRCQGGFCTQHIVRIMQNNFKMDIKKINSKSPGSYLFTGRNREADK